MSVWGLERYTKLKPLLTGYSRGRIPVLGTASILVRLGEGPCVDTTFYVGNSKIIPLFGLSDSRVLGLIPKVSTVNKVCTEDIVRHKKMWVHL